jgi:hypothetical protein
VNVNAAKVLWFVSVGRGGWMREVEDGYTGRLGVRRRRFRAVTWSVGGTVGKSRRLCVERRLGMNSVCLVYNWGCH